MPEENRLLNIETLKSEDWNNLLTKCVTFEQKLRCKKFGLN